ncbi:prealbumin-like fold domain-containing protein, partial [Thomasclavelia saccharogumia]|uniref:prealbumin-like fold domain-containing protein n=1 Tax=Thomasclavelia saccharogumia TaxID=341225 RepID=UPI000556E59A
MKNLKNIKKILILLLAIVTVFTMSGITSYAETRPFGGIDVDLDLYENTVRGADDSFITDLTNAENVVFTNNEELDINLSIRNGLIYGTPSNPIKKEYDSNIKLEHASTFTFNWGTQQLRTLEPLTFVNKVPESINVPVPFYFEEGEQAGSWIFNETKPNELSESTKINVQNLHSLMKENNYTYTYNSGTLHYSPGVKYIASNGTELTSSNNAAWHFEVPMNVKYTVDIKPVTAGGTPTIGGNNTPVDVPKISEVNKEFFRNGNINTYENDYTAPEGTTDQALLNYGDSYNVATNPIDESIVVMSTNATVADPLTGEGSQATSVGVVGGQTSIEVAYGKNVAFTKVDENGDSIAGAEFTVYDGNSVIGSATSDNAGTVNLPTLRMPKLGENVTYTMRETKTPEGYVENEAVYTITIDDKGNATIEGDGAENGKIVNYKPVTITKTSNPDSGEYVKKDQKIDYILTVENTSDKVRDIIVTDQLPEEVKYDTSKPYTIIDQNGEVTTGNHWNGSWTGQIDAKTTLTIIIPTVVTKEYDPVNMEENIITNQASLKAKKIIGNTDEYEKEQFTEEVTHYIAPEVSYTMNKVRVTEPKDGLKGFVAGAGEVIEYKVTFENTGDLGLDIDLNDVFENADYFTFVEASEASIRLEKGETKTVTFKATVNEGTPASDDKGYLNTVTSEGTATYTDPESGNDVTIDKTTQKDLEQTSTANTPVIVVKDPTITKTSDPESGSTVAKG